MIKIISQTPNTLISQKSALGKRIVGVFIMLLGLPGILFVFIEVTKLTLLLTGIATLFFAAGIAVFLFVSSCTYTFDKKSNTLAVHTKSFVSQNKSTYSLSDITRIVKRQEIKRVHGNDGIRRQSYTKYLIEFTNSDPLKIAQNRRGQNSSGVLSILMKSLQNNETPEPVKEIADFLGIEIIDETPNPGKIISNAVHSIRD